MIPSALATAIVILKDYFFNYFITPLLIFFYLSIILFILQLIKLPRGTKNKRS